ncbi:MAG: AMP-binding protein [Candidatus Korobacteraceae bacterium]|jgi:fatty-acyl-CoA synthase
MKTLSYVSGSSSHPLIGETIGNCFERSAEKWSEREALVVRQQNVRYTYAQLKQRVDALAMGLLKLGMHPGDRIGIWSPNNTEWVLLQFASAKIGLILVCINPAYRSYELSYALKKVGCKALVMAPHFRSNDYVKMMYELAPELERDEIGSLLAVGLPDLRYVILIGGDRRTGMLPFDDVSALGGAAERARMEELALSLQFDDPINIQFTSGTTGSPKGATLTHHNLLNNGFFVGEAMRMTEQDRLCIPVPLYHCFGLTMSNLNCVIHGSTMVFPSEWFDPLAVLETVEAERCTAIQGVPAMFIAELEHPEFKRFNLKSLRTGIMAGAPCPIEVMRRCVEQMNLREVTIAYGMTETSPVSFQSAVDDPMERRVSTVGRVQPHIEVKLIDREGRVVPRGTAGEILTRGYCVMLGYWGDPQLTSEAVDQAGWMHTGDMGVLDEEGFCNIVGRIKDMVIRGGENIYPREIEEFLYSHPAVEAVQVFGVPDPKYGEVLCAWIKKRAGTTVDEESIRSFCKERIAHYKVPRYVMFVEDFPMTVTGKAQKYLMRKQVMEKLGLATEQTA